MSDLLLQWLDTHLVHHRWESSRLNILHPLLKRWICDRFERLLLKEWDDEVGA